VSDKGWADEDRDELRGRMRDLARHAERTSAPGLADVRHRRDRRQRNTAMATAFAVVAVLGTTALILNPFGDDTTIQPIGPGLTASSEAISSPGSPLPTSEPVVTTGSPSSATGSPGGGQTSTATTGTQPDPDPDPEPEDPVLAIDFRSLVTAEELDAAGVQTRGPNLGDADGQPTIGPLCAASSWQEQYANPRDFVGGGYPVDSGQVLLDLLSYPSSAEANLALVKLKEDARACPTVNEFLTVEVTAVGSAIGDEFVVFALDAESGEDGSVERIWVTIAREGNVLVAAALDRDPGFTGDVSGDEQLSRAAAEANVEHLRAS